MMRLKQLRLECGKSQEDLAKTFNITQQAISFYESGKRLPDSKTLQLIADYFNVTLDFLLGRSNNRTYSEQSEKDIAVEISRLKDKLMNEDGLLFEGKPVDNETIKAIIDALELGTKYAKAVTNKK